MTNKIFVKGKTDLLSIEYKHLLAVRFIEDELSRRLTAYRAMQILRDFINKEGQIIIGKHYILRWHQSLVYDAFGDDAGFTWISDVKRFATEMPKRCSSESQLLRYQLFDAVYKIVDNPIRLKKDLLSTPL